MRKSIVVRLSLLAVIVLSGILFAAQTFGGGDNETPAAVGASAKVSSHPMEWAVLILIACGAVLFVFRPRRRIQSTSDKS